MFFPQGSERVNLVQHPAHGRDGGAPDGSCFPRPAGAPVGALRLEAARAAIPNPSLDQWTRF